MKLAWNGVSVLNLGTCEAVLQGPVNCDDEYCNDQRKNIIAFKLAAVFICYTLGTATEPKLRLVASCELAILNSWD